MGRPDRFPLWGKTCDDPGGKVTPADKPIVMADTLALQQYRQQQRAAKQARRRKGKRHERPKPLHLLAGYGGTGPYGIIQDMERPAGHARRNARLRGRRVRRHLRRTDQAGK